MNIHSAIKSAALAAALLASAACAPKGPKEFIVNDNTVVDIGTIKEADGPYEFVILYKNETQDTIIAAQSRSTCRCTTPMVNNLPIPPGEYHRIPIKYNPSYQSGHIDEQVDIRYRNGVIKSFPFMGEVVPMKHPVTDHARYAMGRDFYSSRLLISLGLMDPGETKEVYFNLGNDTPRKMKVHFNLEGDYAADLKMRKDIVMLADGRDSVHIRFTMPEGVASTDSVIVKIQPVVDGKPTTESLRFKAVAR